MPRARVDEHDEDTDGPGSGAFPGGSARLPRIVGPSRRPPGVDALEDAPPVMFVEGGFAEPARPSGPTRATFTDYSPPESLFYTHEVEHEVEGPVAPTPHAALGVDPGATWTEIKAAYRGLVAQLHPDRFVTATDEERDAAAEQLAEVNVAYHALAKERR
jgi:hypothetical protein